MGGCVGGVGWGGGGWKVNKVMSRDQEVRESRVGERLRGHHGTQPSRGRAGSTTPPQRPRFEHPLRNGLDEERQT